MSPIRRTIKVTKTFGTLSYTAEDIRWIKEIDCKTLTLAQINYGYHEFLSKETSSV